MEAANYSGKFMAEYNHRKMIIKPGKGCVSYANEMDNAYTALPPPPQAHTWCRAWQMEGGAFLLLS